MGVFVSIFFLIFRSCFCVSILCSQSARPRFIPLKSLASSMSRLVTHRLTVSPSLFVPPPCRLPVSVSTHCRASGMPVVATLLVCPLTMNGSLSVMFSCTPVYHSVIDVFVGWVVGQVNNYVKMQF